MNPLDSKWWIGNAETDPLLAGKHRHVFKLARRHNHPPGYLFHCQRCAMAGIYPFRFIRLEDFWK